MQKQLSVKKLITEISLKGLGLLLSTTGLAFGQTTASATSKQVQNSNQTAPHKAKKNKKTKKSAQTIKTQKSATAVSAKTKLETTGTKSAQPTLNQFKSALATKSHNIPAQKSVAQVRLQEASNPMILAVSTSQFSQTQEMTFVPKDEDKSPFSAMVGASYAESLVDHQDGSKQASRSLTAKLGYSLTENYSMSAGFSVDQDLRDSEAKTNGLNDISLGISHKPWTLADWLKGTLSASTVIPVSEQSTKVIGLQGSLGVGYTFSLTDAVLPMGLKTAFAISANRNFHKYETSADGTVLNPYSMKEILSTSYSFPKYISLSFEFMHRHAWSYGGHVSESFEHSEEIGCDVTPMWGVALGHTNSGSWFKANGQDSNLKLINEDDSIVYLSTSLTF